MDVRMAWLAGFAVCAVAVTACTTTSSTSTSSTGDSSTAPKPTGAAASITIMPKGDLPVVQAPTTSGPTTSGPTTPAPATVVPAQPVATALLITPAPNLPNPPTITPAPGPGSVVVPTTLRPTRQITAPPTILVPRPTCTPGVSPAPSIRSLYPDKVPVAGGTDITIIGSNLDLGPGTTVRFGATSMTPWSVSSGSLSVIAPPGTAGPVTVTVMNPSGCAATAQVTYVGTGPAPAPQAAPALSPCPGGSAPPRITGVSVRRYLVVGGEPVTFTGTGFVSGQTAVLFGAAAASVTSVSPTEVRVVTPPGTAGPVMIKIAVPTGCATMAGDLKYELITPVVTSTSPSQAPKAGGTIVTLNGRNLAGASVKVGGTSATVNGSSDTSLSFVLPAYRYTGNATMIVALPGGGSLTTTFRYTP
ncbi:MAG: IPT/TIG domain-containing protein [Actinomycetales bacterium]